MNVEIVGAAIAAVIIAADLTYRKKHKKVIKRKMTNDEQGWSTFFVTYKNPECKEHIYKKSKCSDMCSYAYLQRIVKFINSAKSSVRLCMCLLTCTEIQDVLIEVKQRGVEVYFLADKEMIGNTAASAIRLKTEGLPIKVPSTPETMLHHKFCIVDAEEVTMGKLFFGSLNLTCQGLTTNCEAVVFTKNKSVIMIFHKGFNDMWLKFNYY